MCYWSGLLEYVGAREDSGIEFSSQIIWKMSFLIDGKMQMHLLQLVNYFGRFI